MRPIDIVKYVYGQHEDYWQNAIEAKEFCLLIGVQRSAATVSNTLRGTRSPSKDIVNALKRREVQVLLEGKLALTDLFKCTDHKSIDALFPAQPDDITPLSESEFYRVELRDQAPDAIALSASEREAIAELARTLISEDRGVVNWNASFQTGASFLATNLRYDERIRDRYRTIYFLRPETRSKLYDRGLKKIAEEIGATNAHFLSKLGLRQVLLVFLNAEAIDENLAPRRLSFKLLKQATEKHISGEAASILTIGKATLPELVTDSDKEFSKRMASKLEVHSGARWAFFLEQWRRFGKMREDTDHAEEAGFVLKRAHWHYEAVKERPVWPINIRLRALFATHPTNYVTFDPTAGFNWLAGSDIPLPAEIVSFVDDVRAFIRNLPKWYWGGKIKVLRSVSTAKYWLSEGALQTLLPRDTELDTEGVEKALDGHLEDLYPAVSVVPLEVKGESFSTYVAGIGVKALVQDDWRKTDPLERSLAHFLIADRLFFLRDEDAELAMEFPYESHWGAGTRFYFVSETIRHLMRTIEAVEPTHDRFAMAAEEIFFPQKPLPESRGCDPFEIVNFCFEQLYQKILNGHEIKPGARALSRKYGAYGLAVEMLQLMSAGGRIGEPHPALAHQYRKQFVRESAIALFNIGELEMALECFRKLQDADLQTVSAEVGFDLASADLDVALVLTILGKEKEARELCSRAQDRLASLRDAGLVTVAHEARIVRLLERSTSRSVHLTYLGDGPEPALAEIKQFEAIKGLQDPELLHIKIASLMTVGTEAEREEAFTTCLATVVDLATKGEQHEALGFRIALGHVLRAQKRYGAAERILDAVHADILRYGCSERTYLAFLIEAGRLLNDQKRPVRAYASYLRAAFMRARARGFVREMQTARTHAIEALEAAQAMATDKTAAEPWADLIEKMIDEDRSYRENDAPKTFGEFARDPLFGYSIAEAGDAIRRLERIEDLRKELAELTA